MTDDQFSQLAEGIAKLTKMQAQFSHDLMQLSEDVSRFRRTTAESFKDVHDDLKDLKASTRVLDQWLEKHPIERIERIEHAQNLPPYVHHQVDDGE